MALPRNSIYVIILTVITAGTVVIIIIFCQTVICISLPSTK